MVTAIRPVTGYTLVLPPGWERIPIRTGTRQAIKKILDTKLRTLPVKVSRDAIAPYRMQIERHLQHLAAESRKRGGLDLYLPVEFQRGVPLAASFVVSEGSLSNGGSVTATSLLASLAAEDEDATVVTIDGVSALRRERQIPADASRQVEYGSRRIDYIASIPGRGESWLIAAFSAVASSEQPGWFSDLQVELFDAIMSTFRWTQADDDSTMNGRSCK